MCICFVYTPHQKGETRHIAIGTLNHIEIAVIFTIRDGICRTISARRARKNERREYRNLHPRGIGQTSR
ncbi:MAG: hypothetical protein COA84_06380 [Robiginitomaculum sp.]|nr:MAG: hypothetical protein COA84_06380 [Robiginitomaculum sp.]